jgi:hypothetical protein
VDAVGEVAIEGAEAVEVGDAVELALATRYGDDTGDGISYQLWRQRQLSPRAWGETPY